MPALSGDDGTPSGFNPGVPFGVWGDSGSAGPFAGGNGIIGSSGQSSGVAGFTLADIDRAAGVFGAGPRVGVAGGVAGSNTAPGDRVGVYGTGSNGRDLGGVGVSGHSDTNRGVAGLSRSGPGVFGSSTTAAGVAGLSAQNTGVIGISNDTGVVGLGGFLAGLFFGDVRITGSLSKAGGGFTIDHPGDPANRYLRHSFVESAEMKNLYDGLTTCDDRGEATVSVPEWFETLNTEICYQITAIGTPAPNLFIAAELHDRQFTIAGGSPGLKVSWQLTGVRHDPWAVANPLRAEEEKTGSDRGHYLHPQLYGQSDERSIVAARHADALQDLAHLQQRDTSGPA
jgi:hypothetical protein